MIPVYIFDEHNQAFYFWHKAKYEGLIKEPLDLFHIDAHSDIDRIDAFSKSLYFADNQRSNYLEYFRNFAKDELGIADYISPAILNGIVKNVYFIYPKWKNLKAKRKKLNIASVFGEGKKIKYGLIISDKTDPKVFKAYPDLRWFNYYALAIEKIPKNRSVILDIDLDYFACIDSTSNLMHYELEITKEQFDQKDAFLNDKRLPFSGFDFNFIEKDNQYYVKISHKKVKDVSYLPAKEEVLQEVENLVDTLKIKKIKPCLITICRSCFSGYCPQDYYNFIETELTKRLEVFK